MKIELFKFLFPSTYQDIEFLMPSKLTFFDKFKLFYYILIYKYFKIRIEHKDTDSYSRNGIVTFLNIFIYDYQYINPIKLLESQFKDDNQEIIEDE